MQEGCGSVTDLSTTGSEFSPTSLMCGLSPCSASKRFRRGNSLPSRSTNHITMMVLLGRVDGRQHSSSVVGFPVRPSQALWTPRQSGGGSLRGHGASVRFMHHMLVFLLTSELLSGASSSTGPLTSTALSDYPWSSPEMRMCGTHISGFAPDLVMP